MDITIPQPDNFELPTVAAVNPIASMQRDTAVAAYDYTLTIDIDGTIKCTGVTPAGICAKLGCAGGVCN